MVSVLRDRRDAIWCARSVRFLLAAMESAGREPPPDLLELQGMLNQALAVDGNGRRPRGDDVPPSTAIITTREAAAVLGIPERTVRHRCARGALPAL